MKHKTLQQLYDRILAANTDQSLYKIGQECGWSNCAVGTFLLEKGIDIRKTSIKYRTITTLLRQSIVSKGMKWNGYLTVKDKARALEFIRELQNTSLLSALRIR